MNKQELVKKIALDAEVTQRQASLMVDSMINIVMDTVAKGEKVQLLGFGTFEMKTRAARTGRNPQTGAAMKIAASQTLSFKPSSVFKSAVPAKKTCKKGGCKKK